MNFPRVLKILMFSLMEYRRDAELVQGDDDPLIKTEKLKYDFMRKTVTNIQQVIDIDIFIPKNRFILFLMS